ncbi:MAG: ferrous iron transport protein A [Holosporales bacterium]|nr:ferrous iron transport protein A [Holosporales bacterium]
MIVVTVVCGYVKSGCMLSCRSLYDLSVGESDRICDFEDEVTADLLTSVGLGVGKIVRCVFKSGTMVITTSYQTIAICQNIARKIYVT